MTEYRTKTGKVLTDEDIQKLADEAEAGYDVEQLGPNRRVQLRDLEPGDHCRISGHLCEVERQARKTTFVHMLEDTELKGISVQLDREKWVTRL